ncbi:MAG TPA: nucleotidyltransferase domain-containing protein [Balneolaceae bacterium]|nr:nucleotidyltransferase domain-containing protein [Balneolaceae bacterium]
MNAKRIITEALPARLVDKLYRLAEKYAQKGVKLFVFGSFANGTNRSTSDLDIGVLWQSERSAQTFRELYDEVQQLPTIRKIDLVDMDLAGQRFREKVLGQEILILYSRQKTKA